MWELVRFNVSNRIRNKMFWRLNVMVLVVFMVITHLDLIVGTDYELSTIYLDSSMNEYSEYLLSGETENVYLQSDIEGEVVLRNGKKGFEINCQIDLSWEQIASIEKDVKNAVKSYYQDHHLFMTDFIKEYEKTIDVIINNRGNNQDISFTVVITIAYFLIMNFSMMIAGEILYEKSTHFSETILVYVSGWQHLLSKIVTGYVIPLIQLGLYLVIRSFCIVLRYSNDKFAGWLKMVNQLSNTNYSFISLDWDVLLKIACLMLASLFLVQLIIMLKASKITNQTQSNLFSSIIYMLMFGVYLLLMALDSNIVESSIGVVLSILPISSMVFMSQRVFLGLDNNIIWIVPVVLDILLSVVVINSSIKHYKGNILNYK